MYSIVFACCLFVGVFRGASAEWCFLNHRLCFGPEKTWEEVLVDWCSKNLTIPLISIFHFVLITNLTSNLAALTIYFIQVLAKRLLNTHFANTISKLISFRRTYHENQDYMTTIGWISRFVTWVSKIFFFIYVRNYLKRIGKTWFHKNKHEPKPIPASEFPKIEGKVGYKTRSGREVKKPKK